MKKSIIAMFLTVASFGANSQHLDFVDGFHKNMSVDEASGFLGYPFREYIKGLYSTGYIQKGDVKIKCVGNFDNKGASNIGCELLATKTSSIVEFQFLVNKYSKNSIIKTSVEEFDFATYFRHDFNYNGIYGFNRVEYVIVNDVPKQYRVTVDKFFRPYER